MRKRIAVAGILACLASVPMQATDVINQDKKAYRVQVQGEGKLGISFHNISAGGSMYGLCGYSFCTFEIPGSKITANKGDRITIRGGKFAIQARRSGTPIGVSAVRDLYGTMIDQGASKGILITTGFFDRDCSDFAQGKPITLLDGRALVDLFRDHGHAVPIALAQRRDAPGLGKASSGA